MNELDQASVDPDGGYARALDEQHMVEAFTRALAPLSRVPIRITHIKAKAVMSRKTVRAERMHIQYRLTIESELGERLYRIMGTTPVGPDHHDEELLARCREARDLPAIAPFRELVGYLPELRLAWHFVPVDLQLPALLELSRPECGPLIAPHLPECREGVTIERVDTELKHYKPSNRCVLRLTARFANGATPRVAPRSLYAKIFADDRGERSYQDLLSVWEAARGSEALRVPEPFGYDADRRLLLMSEAPGDRDLTTWIKCLEADEPLPPGVDLDRVRRCLTLVARAMADLHHAVMKLPTRRTFEGELAQIGKDFDIVVERHPDLSRRFGEVLDRLRGHAPAEEPLVPSHGGFRHKQLVGNDQCLTVIDWDGLTLANPALDAATFIRRLRQEPIRSGRGAALEGLTEHFRQQVASFEPEIPADHLRLYEALTLTETAIRSLRRKGRSPKQLREIDRLLVEADRTIDEIG